MGVLFPWKFVPDGTKCYNRGNVEKTKWCLLHL